MRLRRVLPAHHHGAGQNEFDGTEMHIDPALLSAVAALVGALIGGGASLAAAIYTQRCQDRLQRIAGEVAKRESVYADFMMSASNLLLNAYTHDEIALGGDEQHLIGLINRMRLFAPPNVVRQKLAPLWQLDKFFDKFVILRKQHTDGERLPRVGAKVECLKGAGGLAGFGYAPAG